GGIIGNQITHFIEHDLDITASSPYKLGQVEEVAKSLGRRARVQLKIDTGMERIGIHHETAPKLFEAALTTQHCDITGVFSHFASSESGEKRFTRLQLERFEAAVSWFDAHSVP